MSAENAESIRPAFGGDDATVDELMEALGGSDDQPCVYAGNGYTEKPIEADPHEGFEELIAPEALFPDEAGSSR